MEIYFKIKTFVEFVVPLVIVVLIVFWGLYAVTKSWFKSKLMERLGYKYDKALGRNVAYEFQSHWIKENVKINCREIDRLKYSKIKSYVKYKEMKR